LKAPALLGYFWSSKAAKPVLGLSSVTLYYTSPNGLRVPINYRLYAKTEGKEPASVAAAVRQLV